MKLLAIAISVTCVLVSLALDGPPLKLERSFKLERRDWYGLNVDDVSKDRYVSICIEVVGDPIDIYLVSQTGNDRTAQATLTAGKQLEKFIAAFRGVESEVRFTVHIKANVGFALVVGNCQKKSIVTVNMSQL